MTGEAEKGRTIQSPSMDATVGKLLEKAYKALTTRTPNAFAAALWAREARFIQTEFDEEAGALMLAFLGDDTNLQEAWLSKGGFLTETIAEIATHGGVDSEKRNGSKVGEKFDKLVAGEGAER